MPPSAGWPMPLAEFLHAMECDPASLPVNAGLGLALYFSHRDDKGSGQLHEEAMRML